MTDAQVLVHEAVCFAVNDRWGLRQILSEVITAYDMQITSHEKRLGKMRDQIKEARELGAWIQGAESTEFKYRAVLDKN
jgi:hypothetical protein